MTAYLLDTSVLSALAPGRPQADTAVSAWLVANAGALHLSLMSVVEIEQGIAKLRRSGPGRRADALAGWLAITTEQFGRKLLGIDLDLASAVGRLSDRATAIGRHPGLADVVIAATATAHGLTLLTRNLRHFEPLGTKALDPFVDLPP